MERNRSAFTTSIITIILCAFLAVFSGCASDGDKPCCADGSCAACVAKKGDKEKCCTDGSCEKCQAKKKAGEQPSSTEHPKSTEHPAGK